MRVIIILISIGLCLNSCKKPESQEAKIQDKFDIKLEIEEAEYLASLPMKCIQNQYPYKSGLVISKADDLQLPIEHHPAFYGCFDWHSAVHGHWSLVYLLKRFPDLSVQDSARSMLSKNLSSKNIAKEIEYFSLNKNTKSFERTYGWAWLLKLTEELETWDDPQAQEWYNALLPLADHIANEYLTYLPKLVYPIRVGEHSNTAFGLSFAYDYAISQNKKELQYLIEQRAKDFYLTDVNCPISWEPSGYDFLSPCLEEMNIMRKVLDEQSFNKWLADFLPSISDGTFNLDPGEIKDRSDGKLVHLDGLNFSRAWCLYPISETNMSILQQADKHMDHSLKNITDGDYSGEHWLASFALYALKMKSEHVQKTD